MHCSPTRLLCPWDFPGKILEQAAISFSRGSSQPRNRTQVSCTAGRFFTNWATREAHKYTAAAKSLQSCLTLCDSIDGSPPGSAVPGILQARTLEWVAISFSNAWKWKVKVKSLSCVQLCATPETARNHQIIHFIWVNYVSKKLFKKIQRIITN